MNQEQLEKKAADIEVLVRFMPYRELKAMIVGAVGEEGPYYIEMMATTAELIRTMPVLGEQQELGLEAVAHLHYFVGGSDWYISEKDPGKEGEVNPVQNACFGYAKLAGFEDMAELGFINIQEITGHGAELDLYWEPVTLREIKENDNR